MLVGRKGARHLTFVFATVAVATVTGCTAPRPTGSPQTGVDPSGCTPEYGRTSAEIRQGAFERDAASRGVGGLVVLVHEGYVRPGASRPRAIGGAIVEYRPAPMTVVDATGGWAGRLRAAAAERYVVDSIPPRRYTVRVRAIAHRTMTYDVSVASGRRDTLLIELAAASRCLGAPNDTGGLGGSG
jgi:hypothetical protein